MRPRHACLKREATRAPNAQTLLQAACARKRTFYRLTGLKHRIETLIAKSQQEQKKGAWDRLSSLSPCGHGLATEKTDWSAIKAP